MSVEYTLTGNTLDIKTKYEDFGDFMNQTKDPIYRTIAYAFKELPKKKRVTVIVRGYIENMDFESSLEFTKDQSNMLIDIIIPYFESVEDYETCGEVLKIYKNLVGK